MLAAELSRPRGRVNNKVTKTTWVVFGWYIGKYYYYVKTDAYDAYNTLLVYWYL